VSPDVTMAASGRERISTDSSLSVWSWKQWTDNQRFEFIPTSQQVVATSQNQQHLLPCLNRWNPLNGVLELIFMVTCPHDLRCSCCVEV